MVSVLLLGMMVFSCESEWIALRQADLLSREDTVRYADSLHTAFPTDRCPRIVSGYLRALATRKITDAWRERLSAEDELDAIFRDAAHDPRVYLAYGWLRYQAGMRVDALRLVKRAWDRAADATPPLAPRERAVLHYLAGRIQQDWWRDWRSHGHFAQTAFGQFNCQPRQRQRLPPPNYNEPSTLVDLNVKCPAVFEELMDTFFVSDRELKLDVRAAMAASFRASIAEDSTYWPPAEALAGELAYEGRWDSLAQLARELAVRFPTDFRPRSYLGVVAHQAGRDTIALEYFRSAMEHMPDSVRALYDDPDRVLGPPARRALAAQPPEVQRAFTAAYWKSKDVLFLTDLNERLVEHYSRVTVANLLFREPETGTAGWDTDAGDVWIRWGRPKKIREMAVNNGRVSFWTYGLEPDFVFFRLLTYAPYHTHGDALLWVNRALQEEPTRHVPSGVDTILDSDRQLARYRRRDGTWEVLVLAPYPEFSPSDSVTEGITFLNATFDPVARHRRPSRQDAEGLAVTVSGLQTGTYSIATEILNHTRRALIRTRDTLTLAPASGLAMSDLLIARHVEPLVDGETVLTRRNLRFDYLYGTRAPREASIALYWEIYGLSTRADSTAQFSVTVEITDATERSLPARILRGIGRGFRSEGPRVRLEYERTQSIPGSSTPEWVTIDPDWNSGEYEIVVRIRDRLTGAEVAASRRIIVVQ